ncbi:MAG TPA: phosphoglycerate mutase family protein, partial [Pyrinomonadaceae bacterium]|nr:phosphoglycerate mutase family protein [Pyrinomonadaceae bacterium]
ILAAALFAPLLIQSTDAQSNDDGFKATTVILVRHAEKMDTPREDPPLNEAGVARSQKLAALLASTGVKAIYTSQFLRTKQTAEPLAKQLGITVTPITIQSKQSNPREVSEQSIRQIVDKIMERPGDTALIIGHSNSVPDVIRMLGGDAVPTIDEKKFDDLFIVTVYAKGKAKVVQMKY